MADRDEQVPHGLDALLAGLRVARRSPVTRPPATSRTSRLHDGLPLCERCKSLLQDSEAANEERNTTDNPKYLDELASKGIFAVPTVMVGDRSIQGFRPNTLAELLA